MFGVPMSWLVSKPEAGSLVQTLDEELRKAHLPALCVWRVKKEVFSYEEGTEWFQTVTGYSLEEIRTKEEEARQSNEGILTWLVCSWKDREKLKEMLQELKEKLEEARFAGIFISLNSLIMQRIVSIKSKSEGVYPIRLWFSFQKLRGLLWEDKEGNPFVRVMALGQKLLAPIIDHVEEADLIDFSGSIPEDIPVVGSASAGRGEFSIDGFPVGEGWERVTRPYDVKDPNAFGVEVRGDSMSPRYEDKEIVICSPAKEWKSGDYCVVKSTDEEYFIKRVKRENEHLILSSIAPGEDPILLHLSQVAGVYKIVWKKER